MPGLDLQQPFRVGDWLVDPRERCLTSLAAGDDATRTLSPAALAALLCLAEHHGDLVGLETLAQAIAATGADATVSVAEAVEALRLALDDADEHASYVLAIPERGYSLIRAAHPMPVQPMPAPAPVLDTQAVAREQAEATRGLLQMMRGSRLIQSAVGYLVVSWLVVQVAANTFPALRVPLWGQTLVIVVLVLLFPIAMVIVWARGPAGASAAGGGSPFARMVRRYWRVALIPLVLLVVGGVGYQWWNWLRTSGWTRAPTASIAVLPLLDLSPQDDSGYLGDGLSEELSSRLAQVPGLRVAARTSAFAYRGKDLDVRQIGSQLGVRYVLEGSVRRDGDRVRVTAQLIDAETGYHAWTENYDRDWRDLLKLQEEISRAITSSLRVVLTPEVEERMVKPATQDPKAYDLYLAGLAQFRQSRSLQNLQLASRAFEQALQSDPGFARAYAGLCEVGVARYQLTSVTDEMRAAEDACRKALETDAGLIETELALAGLYRASGRHDQAAIAYQGILARSPENSDALVGLGNALEGKQDLTAAEQSLREAVAVEPGYWGTHNALGNFLFRHGRTAEAAQSYLRVTQLRPGNAAGFNNLGAAMLMSGDLAGAGRAFENSAQIEPNRSAYSNLGTTYYYQRRYVESVRMYEQASELAAEDHQVWGGLADALRRTPDRAGEAEKHMRRAVLLAEQSLGVNSSDATTWAQLGYYYEWLDDTERARRYLERAAEIGGSLPYVQFYLALAAADRDDRAAAIAFLQRAVALGYPMALLTTEPAFDMLRTDPRYKSIAAPKAKPTR